MSFRQIIVPVPARTHLMCASEAALPPVHGWLSSVRPLNRPAGQVTVLAGARHDTPKGEYPALVRRAELLDAVGRSPLTRCAQRLVERAIARRLCELRVVEVQHAAQMGEGFDGDTGAM